MKPVYKSGNKNDPKNYRPISLLEPIFKLYEKVLERRLSQFFQENKTITHLQMGSKPNSGTTEALFQLLSTLTDDKPTLGLLDLSKAYDRVWRVGLWTKLHKVGICGRLLRAVHSTYSSPSVKIRIGNKFSNPYSMENGLRQGSVLSPILFVLLFSDVTDALDNTKGVELGGENFHCQLFVDDSILVTNSVADLINQIDAFNNHAFKWGSVLNIDKTQILTQDSFCSHEHDLSLRNLPKEKIDVAKYLGVWITLKNSTWNQHYNKVLSKARRTFYDLRQIGLRPECMPPTEIISLIKVLVIPQLMYASEVLQPSEAVIKKVDSFLRQMAKKTLLIPESHSNNSVLWEAGLMESEQPYKKLS
jgi:hypothetical protein